MSNSSQRYGNLVSGMMANTAIPQDVHVGMWATALYGPDREPCKVTEIIYYANGNIKGFMLQRYSWKVNPESEGYAVKNWQDNSEPVSKPTFFKMINRGPMKGTVEDALIGHADPFYDRSF